MPHASRRRLTIGRRLFYTHLLVALLVAFGLGSYLHRVAEAELSSALRARLIDNAALAAEAVGLGDWEPIRTPNDTQRPEYAELMRRLGAIVERNTAIERLLVVRQDADRVSVVSDSRGATSGYTPGDSLPASLSELTVGATQARVVSDAFDGFNAMAPLRSDRGKYQVCLLYTSPSPRD